MIKKAATVGVSLALALGVSACSSDASSSSAGAGTSESAKTFLAKAKQLTEEASGKINPTVPASGPKAIRNKKIVIIPCSAAVQGCKFEADQFAAAAKAIGWTTTLIDPAGDPSKMAAAVNRAISIKADGIFTIAIDSTTIQAPLKAAKAAGIKTACFGCVDEPGLLVDVLPAEPSYADDGYLLAAKAFVDSGADLKAILLKDSEFGITKRREKGVQNFIDECKSAGASCDLLATQNILAQDISTSVPKQTVALIRKNPEWNALITPYDAPLTFIIPELRSAGLVAKDKRAYGFDPIEVNVKWIRDSNVEAGTMASPYKWIAYAAVDQMNRAFAGVQPADQGIKAKLVVKDSAPGPGETYLGDHDPASSFKEIWGVK